MDLSALAQRLGELEQRQQDTAREVDQLRAERDAYRELYQQMMERCRKLERGLMGQASERQRDNGAQMSFAVLSGLLNERDYAQGTILLPIVVPDGEDPEALLASSDFDQIADVLLALRAHDDRLCEAIDDLRTQLGEAPTRRSTSSRRFLDEHVVLDLPVTLQATEIADRVYEKLVRLSSSDLRETLGKLKRFVAQHGWEQMRAETEFEEVNLGRWVVNRRRDYKLKRIAEWLRLELEAIPGWVWDVHADRYRWYVQLVSEFIAEHGAAALNREAEQAGEPIGQWANNRRADYRKRNKDGSRKLDSWLVESLEAIPGWSWDPLDAERRMKLDLLRKYVAEHGWETFTARSVYEGVGLGQFVTSCRTRNPPQWLKDELESVPGWSWDPFEDAWQHAYRTLLAFIREHGWDQVKEDTRVDGVDLSAWAGAQRRRYKKHRQKTTVKAKRSSKEKWSREREAALEAIPGWTWDSPRELKEIATHRHKITTLREFIEENGWARFRQKTKYRGVAIGAYVNTRRTNYKKGKPEKYDFIRPELEAIPGWTWPSTS